MSVKNNFFSDLTDRIGSLVDKGRLEITNVLGVGAYGAVYAAKHINQRMYAVKCMPKVNIDARHLSHYATEIRLHAQVSGHPNIISLEKVVETADTLNLVLEYCDEGDL